MSSLNWPSGQTDVTVFRDDGAYIPLSNVLKDDDAILLLTPVVVPPKHHEDSTKDPFECFGRAVAARHPRVRHVPYTAQGGITDYHTVHISMARTVIFVVSGAPIANQPSQIDLAHTALAAGSPRPCIVVVCYGAREWHWKETGFPTIVQVPCCSPAALETTAAALFGEDLPRIQSIEPRQQWPIEVLPDEWSQFDISPIEKLWKTCLPPRYHLSSYVLRSLLDRGGFSRHYVVKSPDTGQTIGFCATYTTFVNSDNTELVGSLAMLLVEPTHRGRGIGLALHGHALSELKKTRGVRRLQLGSTFPRLWYGAPEDSSSIEWFRRRGWAMDLESDGQGRTVSDWVLNIGDWPSGNFSAAMEGFTFRICHGHEHEKVMQFIKDESVRDNTMGLHDEYAASAPFDIVLGLYGTTIVATALTYFPRSGTQAEMDLPWAASIGDDVGGVTCICIAGEDLEYVPPERWKLTMIRESSSYCDTQRRHHVPAS